MSRHHRRLRRLPGCCRRRKPQVGGRGSARPPRAARDSSRLTDASVWCRAGALRRFVRRRPRLSANRPAICSAVSTPTRAAASSMASGMPSRCRQICAIGCALPGCSSQNRGLRPEPARQTNAPPRTARRRPCPQQRTRLQQATRPGAARATARGQATSPGTPSGSRLVARMRRSRQHRWSSCSTNCAASRDKMFAVVKDQQEIAPFQEGDKGIDQRAGSVNDTQSFRDHRGHEPRRL